jgi:SAM-dependent methyltransferase
MHIKKNYLLRSKDRNRALVRVCPELRSQVAFRRINFMDPDLGIAEKMDIIFCRNVVIYFDKPTQQELMRKFHQQLRPGGFLFLGHSETLNGIRCRFHHRGLDRVSETMKRIIAEHHDTAFLKPGEAIVSPNPILVSTVLGIMHSGHHVFTGKESGRHLPCHAAQEPQAG